ncbi:hypothetical protein HPB49_020750 [Dermacentor silvarum]|uniref:Uncharacterized protein n=1 Tax=Dermacentor silvarum TaxID=543639 RepID=A0ACB8CHI1_DERSI|nr:hypothetical protein HPB49_020750 [Dermacentor silvarum]
MSASSAIHSEPSSKAPNTVGEAVSAASATEACGDDAGDEQYCDPWDTDTATVALRLLRAEEQRNKSPTPTHVTPASGRAPSADKMARQRHIYKTASTCVSSSEFRTRAWTKWPRALSHSSLGCSSSGVQAPSTRCRRRARLRECQLHQGSSGGGNPPVPIPAIRDPGLAFMQASAAIDQSHPLPRSPISENSPAAPVGAVAVKRSIHADVRVLSSGFRDMGHRVVGVEFVEDITREYFRENDLEMEESVCPVINCKILQTPDKTIRIFICDIFDFKRECAGYMDIVWDRSGFTCVLQEDRPRYAALIKSLLADDFSYGLWAVTYDAPWYNPDMADDNHNASNDQPGASATDDCVRTTPAPQRDVAALSLRIYQYWPAYPKLWIAQVNSQFGIARVTS